VEIADTHPRRDHADEHVVVARCRLSDFTHRQHVGISILSVNDGFHHGDVAGSGQIVDGLHGVLPG
jgi:hypothetical protein